MVRAMEKQAMEKQRVFIDDRVLRERPDGDIALVGSVCKACGHRAYPATSFCSKCLSKDQSEYELFRDGFLYSYTITRVPVGSFPVPHPFGYIMVPESGARVTAPLFIEEEALYRVGAKVRMEIAAYWEEEDKVVIGPKYRIVKEDAE
jgi:uncharacterized OB-fold protein